MNRNLSYDAIDQGLAEAERLVAAFATERGGPDTATGFSLAQTLQHCAQSIEFAIDGFPVMKPALFRSTIGTAAFAVFSMRGRMSHDLAGPIPGAPRLDSAMDSRQALARLQASANRFENHAGVLAPHFTFGRLDKAAYAKANAMHLANHFSAFDA